MKPTRLALAGILAAFFFAAPAAASADILSGVGTYAKDRFHDALDIVRLRAGFPRDGKAIGAKARVTSLAQAGYVAYDGTYVGLDRRGVGVVNEDRQEAGISVLYGSYNKMVPVWGNGFLKGDTDWSIVEDRRILRNLPHWDDGRQRHLSIGAEVATPLFGIDAGIYPEEVLDFALGFFVLDIFNDDELFDHYMPYQEATTLPEPDEKAPFAKKRQQYEELQDRIKLQQAIEYIEAQEQTSQRQFAPPSTEGAAITPGLADEAMEELDRTAAPSVESLPIVEEPVPAVDEEPVDKEVVDEQQEETNEPATPEENGEEE